jgi:hypothetical protein
MRLAQVADDLVLNGPAVVVQKSESRLNLVSSGYPI